MSTAWLTSFHTPTPRRMLWPLSCPAVRIHISYYVPHTIIAPCRMYHLCCKHLSSRGCDPYTFVRSSPALSFNAFIHIPFYPVSGPFSIRAGLDSSHPPFALHALAAHLSICLAHNDAHRLDHPRPVTLPSTAAASSVSVLRHHTKDNTFPSPSLPATSIPRSSLLLLRPHFYSCCWRCPLRNLPFVLRLRLPSSASGS